MIISCRIHILLLTLLLGMFTLTNAQVLNFQVKLHTERLQPRDREDLQGLEQKLTDYINNSTWSDHNQDIILEGNLQIIVETFSTRGSDKIYRGQFLISSPSGENFRDKACEFTYFPSQAFEFYRTSFEPLLSLVDYYMNMVLGGEMDTFELFAGTPFYNKAQDIANQGQLSNYQLGWTKRLEQVIRTTDADHVALREAKFYYYEGLYFVEKKQNPVYARKFAKGVVKRLEKVYNKRPNSAALKRFLDSHFQALPKLLQFDKNRDNLNVLIRIDARHRDTYRKVKLGF
ncbi:MAG TPA: DUF4835 family protein [Caldithrix sp.]|nr:DUF4835 family protein [Caldithrix sp.]